ncbi:serine hydrolase domain-containing protein [Acinetobacter bereziniae]|uniref:serine hydrolase domain-containing protein n=1 Tax=Acinetobacter bereziniae TaxID=106648 RepID=UPI002954983F|nr:serine hydrolase domain-containing protein [Acinetobacter bereziniae]MDV8154870.1 serine hydrolase domain-containing protein [Acinetobacter bereziniae]
MFKKIKFMDVILVFIIIIVISLIAHFTLIARNQFFRFIYPVEAILSKNSINCSANSPNWMRSSIIYSIENNGSLANQLFYITQRGKTYHCESGWKDFPLFSEHIDEHTRYRYASLTKPITASLVLKMVADKKLKLDDHVVKYFPELKYYSDERIKNITIENLLTHTSGFDRLKSNDPLFNTYEKPWCPYDLNKMKNLKLDHPIGTIYAYDNRNYCLLSIVVERLTGKSFRSVLSEKMNLEKYNIQFVNGPFGKDEVKYDFRYEPVFTYSYTGMFDFNALSAVAGLSGSAESYAKLLSQVFGDKQSILSSSSMDTGCKLNEIKSCFSLGLSRYKKNGHSIEVKWHDGGLPGANSLMIRDEKGGITVWTGNGSPPENAKEYVFFKYLYKELNSYYKSDS